VHSITLGSADLAADVRCWHIASVRCDAQISVAIEGIADIRQSLAARRSDAIDPNRKSRLLTAGERSSTGRRLLLLLFHHT
jgi:hypothetical protein